MSGASKRSCQVVDLVKAFQQSRQFFERHYRDLIIKKETEATTDHSQKDRRKMDKLTAPHESVDTLADKVQKIEIDQSKLTALSPEVISRQATVSIRISGASTCLLIEFLANRSTSVSRNGDGNENGRMGVLKQRAILE